MDANLYELIRGRRHYLNAQLIRSYMYQLLRVRGAVSRARNAPLAWPVVDRELTRFAPRAGVGPHAPKGHLPPRY